MAIANSRKGEEERLAAAIHRLKEEGPTILASDNLTDAMLGKLQMRRGISGPSDLKYIIRFGIYDGIKHNHFHQLTTV